MIKSSHFWLDKMIIWCCGWFSKNEIWTIKEISSLEGEFGVGGVFNEFPFGVKLLSWLLVGIVIFNGFLYRHKNHWKKEY